MEEVEDLVTEIIDIIDQLAHDRDIPAKTLLVGSVAKGTWLKGKADIDIFISFPLDCPEKYLKDKGLELGRACINRLDLTYEKRYASHPYITGFIKDYDIDFVPCYDINYGEELKSAVDRTILHMEYVKANLKQEQQKEVMLLKRFMEMVGTYGSEFKVGGFAGYLCELLVLRYGSFREVLKAAWTQWGIGYIIDLKGYDTANLFNDPLIVIDPVDRNRNVAAALSLQKMSEFMAAAGNFLKDEKKEYFEPVQVNFSKETIGKDFHDRGTKTVLISFQAPDIPADALHPQIKKTEKSLANILTREGFKLMGSDYWSDEQDSAVILLELETWNLPRLKKHPGPSVWNRAHALHFREVHPQAWVEGDRWTAMVNRKFQDVESLLRHLLSPEGIRKVRGGKHVKKSLLEKYSLTDPDRLLETADEQISEFLYFYIHKSRRLWR